MCVDLPLLSPDIRSRFDFLHDHIHGYSQSLSDLLSQESGNSVGRRGGRVAGV